MADGPEIEIVGLKELLKDLRAAEDHTIDDAIKQAHRDSVETVKQTATPLIPSVSGALLGSLRTTASLRGGRVAVGKAKVPYAHPIHWGWPKRHISPNTFLTDALSSNSGQALDAFETGINKIVMEIGP